MDEAPDVSAMYVLMVPDLYLNNGDRGEVMGIESLNTEMS